MPQRIPSKITVTDMRNLMMTVLLFHYAAGHARVQVLALQDGRGATRAISAPAVFTDSFCVVSSGGSVKLTFKNSNGTDTTTRSWRAINAAGQSVRYQQSVALAGDPVPTIVSDPSTASIIVPAGKAATAPGACGAGNLLKGITALDPISPNNLFSDTVTIVTSPL